jgi:hypothetical protein
MQSRYSNDKNILLKFKYEMFQIENGDEQLR